MPVVGRTAAVTMKYGLTVGINGVTGTQIIFVVTGVLIVLLVHVVMMMGFVRMVQRNQIAYTGVAHGGEWVLSVGSTIVQSQMVHVVMEVGVIALKTLPKAHAMLVVVVLWVRRVPVLIV